MKKVIGFIILSVFFCQVNAQIILKGSICSSVGEPVPFVNVALFMSTDTTKLVCGSITDTEGNYVLPSARAGKYRIMISAIGYCTIKEDLYLRMPSAGNIVTRNFTIEETATALDEVVIKASRKTSHVDKSIYTFSKEQIKNARYSNDLLNGIEDLSIDVMNNKISKLGGGSVKILINGVNATDNDLKSIPADKVLKVEYYDIPPARYATISTLVNVITKRLDTGWNGGIEATHAFSTGFGNDDFYLQHIAGNHQFAIDYELRYRDYNEQIVKEDYRYKLNEEYISYLYNEKNKFGYTNHNINLKYTYSKPNDYALQASFSPNFSNNFSEENSKIQVNKKNIKQHRKGIVDRDIQTFGPSGNVYFSKKMKHGQELTLDVVGTYYHNKQKTSNHEFEAENNQTTLEDRMDLKNQKKSLIGEIAYTKTRGTSILSLGYKSTLASSHSTISNYLSDRVPYDYKSANNNHYLYAEYGNTWKRLMYRIGIGGTWIKTYNDDTQYKKLLLTPKIILGYKLTSNQNLQWVLTASPSIPSISQLSNNATLITNELLRRGNPYLHSGNSYITTLRYNWNNSWIDFKLAALATYERNSISTYYKEENINGERYIVSTLENAKFNFQYGGFYYLSIRPFKNEVLSIKLYGMLVNQTLNSSIIGKFSHLYKPIYYSLNFRKGAWGATYVGNIVSRQIDGAYLRSDENQSNLQIFYQLKKIRLTAGCFWLFNKSKYNSETLANSLLQHNKRTHINDNRSMFTLGFSWNFSTGKSLNIKRKIENRDTDKGTF